MPKTDESQNGSNRKPNWVEVSTLVVLTLTLIAGGILACLAYQQNELTRIALEINSRPILTAGFLANIAPQVGQKINVEVIVENVGKMPTKAHIKSNVLYSLTQIPSPGLLPAEKVQLVWPSKKIGHTAESGETITEGQLSDLKAGRGWLYVNTLIEYGSYHTSICSEYRASTDLSHLTSPNLCSDPKSNDAN